MKVIYNANVNDDEDFGFAMLPSGWQLRSQASLLCKAKASVVATDALFASALSLDFVHKITKSEYLRIPQMRIMGGSKIIFEIIENKCLIR